MGRFGVFVRFVDVAGRLVCSRIAAASRQQFEAAASNNRLALFAPDGCLHEPLR